MTSPEPSAATVPTSGTTAGSGPGLAHNRNYQLTWFGGAISGLGDIVFTTAVVLWVGAIIAKDKPWAPLAVSGVLVSALVPTVVLGAVGGVYADRWNRRRTMLITDLIRAAVVGALILLPTWGDHLGIGAKLGLVYAGVAVENAVAQFFNPARFGLLGVVVPDADRERAGSISQGTQALTSIIGPPLAAPLLISASHGPQWALAVNALSFLVSFIAISFIRVPASDLEPDRSGPPHSAMQDFRAGLRFLLGNPILRFVIVAIVIVTFGAGAINVLDLFFVTRNLHVAASLYGLVDAAFGAGLTAGAILFAAVGGRIGARKVFAYGLLLGGIGVVGYSRSTVLWEAMVILFALAVPIAGVNSMVGPLLFREVPRDMLGRIIGVINPVQQAASFASIAIATWLASTVLRRLDAHVLGVHLTAIDTIFAVSGLLIAGTGVWALTALRGLGGPPTPAADDVSVTEALASVEPTEMGTA
jgi:MFS family permease